MSKITLPFASCAGTRSSHQWMFDGVLASLFLAFGVEFVLGKCVSGRMVPGGLMDARFNLTMLEYFYRTLSSVLHGHHASFTNAPFFYPWPLVTNFSDTFWGNGEVYAIFRALGADRISAFRFFFILGFVFTYISSFICFRLFGLRPWGAAVGAFLFTFPLPMATQFDHAQLVYRLWMPPAVLALDRFLTRGSFRASTACMLFVALQLSVSIYLGLFLCLLLASYAGASILVSRGHIALPRLWGPRTVDGADIVVGSILSVVALAILAVVIIPYLDVRSLYGFRRPWSDVVGFLPRPSSYFLAGSSDIWPHFRGDLPFPQISEQQLFPGLAAIISLVWFAVSKRARARRQLAAVMLLTFGILFAITVDLGGHTIYRLVYFLPGFSAVRAVARVILAMMLPLSMLLGLLIDDLVETRRIVCRAIAVMLSAFLIVESSLISPALSKPSAWRNRLLSLEAQLPRNLPKQAVLAVRTSQAGQLGWVVDQADAELAAVTLGIHTVNGLSGNFPPGWRPITTCGDVLHDIRAGQRFLAEHHLPVPIVRASQMVLIGLPSCDLTELGKGSGLRPEHTYRSAKEAVGEMSITARGRTLQLTSVSHPVMPIREH